jgi:hypothetical protein
MFECGLMLCLVALVCASGARANDLSSARQRFAAADSALSRHSDGYKLDDDPGAPDLMRARWTVVQDWVSDYFALHPDATANAIKHAVRDLSPALESETIKIDSANWLVSVQSGEQGDVFMITRLDHRAQLSWSMSQYAEGPGRKFTVLGAWSADRALDDCTSKTPEDEWRSCGPLFASIGRLPDTSGGLHRFYVDAWYAQQMGATMGAQLSLWVWNGEDAQPIKIVPYAFQIDQPGTVRVEGDLLRLRHKDEFKSFFACGGCEGRQRVQSFQIVPDDVSDLGDVSVAPDLDLVDELFRRVLDKTPANELATPAVIAILSRFADTVRSDTASFGQQEPSLNMLEGWKAKGTGMARTLCLSTDAGTLKFKLSGVGSKTKVIDVKVLGDIDVGCGRGAQM